MQKVRVKICCISSIEESNMAIRYGASAIGLVGKMPSGPGIITDEMINLIAQKIPPPISSFLLTSETTAPAIIEHYKKVNTTTIQLVDALNERQYHTIKEALPNIKIVQVIHVIDENSIKEAEEISSFVDAILLDSGNPNLLTKELGGTGRTHNWLLSKRIRESVNVPLFLAGGINEKNVKEALDIVCPFGVDLCSGVRTNGKLDERKLSAFFDALG